VKELTRITVPSGSASTYTPNSMFNPRVSRGLELCAGSLRRCTVAGCPPSWLARVGHVNRHNLRFVLNGLASEASWSPSRV